MMWGRDELLMKVQPDDLVTWPRTLDPLSLTDEFKFEEANHRAFNSLYFYYIFSSRRVRR